MEEQKNLKPVELGERLKGEIDLPTVDITPFIGKKVKIDLVGVFEGDFGYYVKVETESVGEIETKDGKAPIRASRIFGLQEDAQGAIGWGKDTNLGVYLAKMKVDHFDKLVGKEVYTQSITSKKTKADYLSFN